MLSVHRPKLKGSEQFRCAQAGCQECLEELLRGHRGLVLRVVERQWKGERLAYADLVQEGWIALWQASLSYEPERGVAFSTYAGVAIARRIWRVVGRAEAPPGWPWPVEAEGVEEAVEAAWVRQELVAAVARLPGRLSAMVTALYGLDGQPPQTLAEVGVTYGLTRERVRQLRNDALVQLRLPAFSQRLQQLCDQRDRAAYRRRQQLSRQWQRWRRGRLP
jgi:RNA polymerase sigma factor (sigma-70 family)